MGGKGGRGSAWAWDRLGASRARICKPFKAPKRAGTTILFVVLVPVRQATWAGGSIPRNRFLGSLNVYKDELRTRTAL
jgi:hypothetical protein